MSRYIPPTVACVCCEKPGPHVGRGLRRRCYWRYAKARTLDRFPKRDAGKRDVWVPTKPCAHTRLADYRFLIADGVTGVDVIARRLGNVSVRTVERYAAADRHLRAQAQVAAVLDRAGP